MDDKRRQPTAAKRVDPLGKMQLPFREGRYLCPATDPLPYSLRKSENPAKPTRCRAVVFLRTGIAMAWYTLWEW